MIVTMSHILKVNIRSGSQGVNTLSTIGMKFE
jgi:hypothetical protein